LATSAVVRTAHRGQGFRPGQRHPYRPAL